MAAAMGTTKQVKDWLRKLKEAGCKVESDFTDALTAVAYDGAVKVFVAIQKGKGQPWIIRFISSERITWQ